MWSFLLLWLAAFSPFIHATPDQPELTFEELYFAGRREYTSGEWQQCIGFMRRAIEDFRYVEDEVFFCRHKCAGQIESPTENHETQRMAEAQRALCVLRCKRDKFTELHPGIKKMSTVFDMMERKPYEYLHICYWNAKELSLAVQSAYTFLTRNPGHKDVVQSLNFYMQQPGYDDSMLVDAERSQFEINFIAGVKAYDDGDYSQCTHSFDSAISSLLNQEQKCRYLCEDKVDWSVIDGNPELDVLITSIRASVARCQHGCLLQLSRVNGFDIGHPIAAIYEYLHFCQFKLKRGADAMKSVGNYLLFDDNPFMRRNRLFYKKIYENDKFFEPDQKMIEIAKKRKLEEKYLNFVDEKFRLINNDFPPEQADDRRRISTEVSIEDNFLYEIVPSLLSTSECQHLRSIFPLPFHETLTIQIETRIKSLYPNVKYISVSCSNVSRDSDCRRAIVLSIESSDCSEWLGSVFTGCAIQFCV